MQVESSFNQDKGEYLNIEITDNGSLVKRRSWRSFWGMVKNLYEINKQLKRFDVEMDYQIRLPLPLTRKPNAIKELFKCVK
jgi:5-methylcytosine-specific restriction endonuclease McrBC GTP-binding regulatory subunit McrB